MLGIAWRDDGMPPTIWATKAVHTACDMQYSCVGTTCSSGTFVAPPSPMHELW
jgi:hypothetical protein